MTTNQSARSAVISSSIDEIILEKLIAKEARPGDALTMEYLANESLWPKRHIHFLKKFENDLYSIDRNGATITSDNELLLQKSREHFRNLIKKYVYTSKYAPNTFEYDVGKLIDETYYTQQEINFIDEVYKHLLDASNIDLYSFNLINPPDAVVMRYNMLNHCHFHYSARNVYNEILQGTLHAGDDITELLHECLDESEKSKLFQILMSSQIYEWFFEPDDNKIILRCDLETNRNLFIMNFLNTILYRFTQHDIRIKLLRQIQVKFGSLLRVELNWPRRPRNGKKEPITKKASVTLRPVPVF